MKETIIQRHNIIFPGFLYVAGNITGSCQLFLHDIVQLLFLYAIFAADRIKTLLIEKSQLLVIAVGHLLYTMNYAGFLIFGRSIMLNSCLYLRHLLFVLAYRYLLLDFGYFLFERIAATLK